MKGASTQRLTVPPPPIHLQVEEDQQGYKSVCVWGGGCMYSVKVDKLDSVYLKLLLSAKGKKMHQG